MNVIHSDLKQTRHFCFYYRRRRMVNACALFFSACSMTCGLFWLGWILFTLISRALPGIHTIVFTSMTPPPGSKGGLLNAIYGSLALTGTATVIGTPIGILAGTYLAELSEGSWIGSTIRFINSILLSAPSVVIGFFIYALVVSRSGHFSGWAGAFALAAILIPVVVSSTENMLRLVPQHLREAAFALGASRSKTIVSICYRSSRKGILTGVLLGIARISGETAPLLFTSLNNQFWSTDMSKAMANLPVVIFQFAMSPYEEWQHLAWVGALMITLGVLALNIFARLFLQFRGTRT